jgi:hypothetical protein
VQRARGRLVVVVSGVALVSSSFVPLWATYRVPGLGLVAPETSHQNAWTAYGLTMQLALALVVVATVLAAVARSSDPRVLLVVCAASLVLLAWQVVRGPEGSSDPSGYGIERGLLLFTGAALAAAMTYGSHLAWKETGLAPRVRG